MDTLTAIQEWFSKQCDGEREHTYGIRIETLDNPGWAVDIELQDTDFEALRFDEVSIHRSNSNWIRCWKDRRVFHGRGGLENLTELLNYFIAWTSDAQTPKHLS